MSDLFKIVSNYDKNDRAGALQWIEDEFGQIPSDPGHHVLPIHSGDVAAIAIYDYNDWENRYGNLASRPENADDIVRYRMNVFADARTVHDLFETSEYSKYREEYEKLISDLRTSRSDDTLDALDALDDFIEQNMDHVHDQLVGFDEILLHKDDIVDGKFVGRGRVDAATKTANERLDTTISNVSELIKEYPNELNTDKPENMTALFAAAMTSITRHNRDAFHLGLAEHDSRRERHAITTDDNLEYVLVENITDGIVETFALHIKSSENSSDPTKRGAEMQIRHFKYNKIDHELIYRNDEEFELSSYNRNPLTDDDFAGNKYSENYTFTGEHITEVVRQQGAQFVNDPKFIELLTPQIDNSLGDALKDLEGNKLTL